jgi:hypothetical protein
MITEITYVCEHCKRDTTEKEYDVDLGMCMKCVNGLRVDFKQAKDKPAKKYRIKLHD